MVVVVVVGVVGAVAIFAILAIVIAHYHSPYYDHHYHC